MNKGFSFIRAGGYVENDKFSSQDLDDICGTYTPEEFEDYAESDFYGQIEYVINRADFDMTKDEFQLLDMWAKIPQSKRIQIRNLGIVKL